MLANIFITASILSFSLQGWHDFWQGLTVVSLAIAFIAGFGANRTGKRMAKIQETEIRTQSGTIVTLSTKLEEQRQKTAEAERTLLEVQERFVPRRLVGEQRAKFVSALENVPTGKVVMHALNSDPEAWPFASDIKDALSSAGFDVEDTIHGFFVFGKPTTGLEVEVKDPSNPPRHLDGIRNAFEQVLGTRPATGADKDAGDAVKIAVGIKPQSEK